jgi:hypothetical protein
MESHRQDREEKEEKCVECNQLDMERHGLEKCRNGKEEW